MEDREKLLSYQISDYIISRLVKRFVDSGSTDSVTELAISVDRVRVRISLRCKDFLKELEDSTFIEINSQASRKPSGQ